jgi:type IV pilus assembly protein PilV
MKTPILKGRQHGSSLLEGLIAISIFSIAILGLIGMQARAITHVGDAKYRADASDLANEIIGQIWADRANIASYAHHPVAGANACAPGGAPSGYANVTSWLSEVQNTLPGASAIAQQIFVGANNVVTVTVCWKAPTDAVLHNYVASAQVNG